MGLGWGTITTCLAGMAVFMSLYILLVACLTGERAGNLSLYGSVHLKKAILAFAAVMVLSLGVSMVMTGIGDFYYDEGLLCGLETFPMHIEIRMRHLMKSLGCKAPDRRLSIVDDDGKKDNALVNYPMSPMRFREGSSRFNTEV